MIGSEYFTLLSQYLPLTISKVRIKRKADLVALAKEVGIDSTGNKTAVFNRVWDFLEKKRNEPQTEEKYISDEEEPPATIEEPTQSTVVEADPPADAVEEPAEQQKQPDPEPVEESTNQTEEPQQQEEFAFEEPEQVADDVSPEENEEMSAEEPVVAEVREYPPQTPAVTEPEPVEDPEDPPKEPEIAKELEDPEQEPEATEKDDMQIEEQSDENTKSSTSCLLVTGFRRPVNVGKLKSLFTDYGSVNNFWMDDYKNHALVEFEDSATSEKVFQTLNETHWPTDIPKDHASFLKMCYESESFEDAKVRVQDEHANKDPETMNTQNPLARVPAPVDTERNVTRKERIESVAGEIKSPRELTTRKRKRDENETTEEKMRKAEHKVAQLFRCTEEAKPKIFWKPLTQEEYIERQKRKRQRRTYQERRTREDRRRRDYHRNDRRDHHDRRDRRGYRRDHDRRDRRDRDYGRRDRRDNYRRRDRSRSRGRRGHR